MIIDILVRFISNINVQMYILSYIVGSIPFGFLISKIFFSIDITKHGSKSTGSTNTLRVLKQHNIKNATFFGILTLMLDALKGTILILIAMSFGFTPDVLWAIAVFCVLGHCYSIFLNFEGGKGAATALGSVMILLPLESFIGAFCWILSAKVFKISSLASLIGLICGVISSFFIHPTLPYIDSRAPLMIISFIIIYKHIPNIYRLLTKQEGKVL